MRNRRPHLAILIMLLAVAQGQLRAELTTVPPETVGLSSARLERITNNLHQLIEQEQLAGAVTLVSRRGKVAYLLASGWQDKENKTPMKANTIFRIASMTKPVTSVGVMMLHEEGHFQLEDPVSKFIPEWKEMNVLLTKEDGSHEIVSADRPVTIHQLLTHTSGLAYHWDAKVGNKYNERGITHGLIEDPDTIGDSVRKLADVPLLHHPGERFSYGLNTDVLGYLVEKISGKKLDEFFRERIFMPLGMKDTKFFLDQADMSRLATVYRPGRDGKIVPETRDLINEPEHFQYTVTYPYSGAKRYFSGGGGLCSTVSDYFRFCQMLLNNGRLNQNRLLSRKTVELMTSQHVELFDNDLDQAGFGLGFMVLGRPGGFRELGSSGTFSWGGFFYTTFFIDPQEELIGISMAQLHPSGDVDWNSRFRTLVYQAIDD